MLGKGKKVTSAKVAKIAGKLLPKKNLSKKTKAPIASALSQREKVKRKTKKRR